MNRTTVTPSTPSLAMLPSRLSDGTPARVSRARSMHRGRRRQPSVAGSFGGTSYRTLWGWRQVLRNRRSTRGAGSEAGRGDVNRSLRGARTAGRLRRRDRRSVGRRQYGCVQPGHGSLVRRGVVLDLALPRVNDPGRAIDGAPGRRPGHRDGERKEIDEEPDYRSRAGETGPRAMRRGRATHTPRVTIPASVDNASSRFRHATAAPEAAGQAPRAPLPWRRRGRYDPLYPEAPWTRAAPRPDAGRRDPWLTEENLMRMPWTRRHLSRLGLVASAGLVLVLAAGPAGAAGTFRIAVGVDLDSVEPVQITTTTVTNMVDYVVETLTLLGADGKVQPWLAESWTLSPEGTVYAFLLQKGNAGPAEKTVHQLAYLGWAPAFLDSSQAVLQ